MCFALQGTQVSALAFLCTSFVTLDKKLTKDSDCSGIKQDEEEYLFQSLAVQYDDASQVAFNSSSS